jgi:hypothetical protein
LTAGAFQDDKWMVLELGPDPAQTIIGQLDAAGQFVTSDTLIFPCLLGWQPIDVYSDTVTIHISRVDAPDSFFMYTTPLSPEGNNFTFTLDQLGLPGK